MFAQVEVSAGSADELLEIPSNSLSLIGRSYPRLVGSCDAETGTQALAGCRPRADSPNGEKESYQGRVQMLPMIYTRDGTPQAPAGPH